MSLFSPASLQSQNVKGPPSAVLNSRGGVNECPVSEDLGVYTNGSLVSVSRHQRLSWQYRRLWTYRFNKQIVTDLISGAFMGLPKFPACPLSKVRSIMQ
jgi:hypothetical protein